MQNGTGVTLLGGGGLYGRQGFRKQTEIPKGVCLWEVSGRGNGDWRGSGN